MSQQSQQSWTAWLLDAYANSIAPTPSEKSEHDESDIDSTSPSSPQSTTSALPYGPYVRTGRGGAGNFTWQSQHSLPSPNGDLEAQKPSTLSERRKAAAKIEHLDTGAAIKSQLAQRSVSQYIRVGRGFVQSNEIQQSPRSVSMPLSPMSPMISSTPSSAVHPGRGGAGNYAAAAELKEKQESEKEKQERLEADRRRIQIEEEVQGKILPPPDAWLGGRRRSTSSPVDELV